MKRRCYSNTYFFFVLFLSLHTIPIVNARYGRSAYIPNSKDSSPHHQSLAAKLSIISHRPTESSSLATKAPAVIVPGVYDALSAKIFIQQGAQVIFLSGFGVSASKLGEPDVGILTQTELIDTARMVIKTASKADVPVIVDADTGFGGVANIRRTVRDLADAGAAAISIEDQIFPKKCTYAAGDNVRVISREESVARIQTAIAARNEAYEMDGNEILIVARTDCRASLGLNEVIERCKLFEEAGADFVYAENLSSRTEYELLRKSLSPNTRMILAQVQLSPPSGRLTDDTTVDSPQVLFSNHEIGDMGYNMALFGITGLQGVIGALKTTADTMLSKSPSSMSGGGGLVLDEQPLHFASFDDVKKVVGFDDTDLFTLKL